MKIITFEDHGQDFHTWEVDSAGIVVSSLPFQGWLWCGGFVVNHKEIAAGMDVVFVKAPGESVVLKYPVISVTERPSKFAVERAPSPGSQSKLKRFLTPKGGWSFHFSEAETFPTRDAASKRLRKRIGTIIEV